MIDSAYGSHKCFIPTNVRALATHFVRWLSEPDPYGWESFTGPVSPPQILAHARDFCKPSQVKYHSKSITLEKGAMIRFIFSAPESWRRKFDSATGGFERRTEKRGGLSAFDGWDESGRYLPDENPKVYPATAAPAKKIYGPGDGRVPDWAKPSPIPSATP
jgi:hypothetical protein